MFNKTKYTNWYWQIIDRAKKRTLEGYGERHHIIPRSLGGDDSSENLVKLSAREHYLVHWLLIYMTHGYEKHKMQFAFWQMCQMSSNQERVIKSRIYEIAKLHMSEASGIRSPETKQKMSDWQKGKKLSEKHKQKISEKMKGKKFSDSRNKKISNSHKGKLKTEEHRKNLSLARKGKLCSKRGPLDLEWKEKISKANSKKIIINSIEYPSLSLAAKQLGFSVAVVSYRIKSKSFPTWVSGTL